MSNTEGSQRLSKDRMLVVLDIENVCGGPRFTVTMARDCTAQLLEAVGAPTSAHVVVAASSREGALAAGLALPAARLCWRAGPDGADRALREVLEQEQVEERFATVVIASGDHAFAGPLRRLRLHGLTGVVACRRGHVSRQLARAASRVVYLPAVNPFGAGPIAAAWKEAA